MADAADILRLTQNEGVIEGLQRARVRGSAIRAQDQRTMMLRAEGLLNAAKAAPTPEIAAQLFNQAWATPGLLPEGQRLMVTPDQVAPGLKFLEALNDQPPEVRALGLKSGIDAGIFQFEDTKADAIIGFARAAQESEQRKRDTLTGILERMATGQTGRQRPAMTAQEIADTSGLVQQQIGRLEQELAVLEADLADPLVSDDLKVDLRQRQESLSRQLGPLAAELSGLQGEGRLQTFREQFAALPTQTLQELVTANAKQIFTPPSFEEQARLKLTEAVRQGDVPAMRQALTRILKGKDLLALTQQVIQAKVQQTMQELQRVVGVLTEARDAMKPVAAADQAVQADMPEVTGLLEKASLDATEAATLQAKGGTLETERGQYNLLMRGEDEAAGQVIQSLIQQRDALKERDNLSPQQARELDTLELLIQYTNAVRQYIRINPFELAQREVTIKRQEAERDSLDVSDPEQATRHRELTRNVKLEDAGLRQAKAMRQQWLSTSQDLANKLRGRQRELVKQMQQLQTGMGEANEVARASAFVVGRIRQGMSVAKALQEGKERFAGAFSNPTAANSIRSDAKLAFEERNHPYDSLSQNVRDHIPLSRQEFLARSRQEQSQIVNAAQRVATQSSPLVSEAQRLFATKLAGIPGEPTEQQRIRAASEVSAELANRGIHVSPEDVLFGRGPTPAVSVNISPASPGERQDIAEARAQIDSISEIESLFRPEFVGPLQGRLGALAGATDLIKQEEAQFRAATTRLGVDLRRFYAGTAQSAAEMRSLFEAIPTINMSDTQFMAALQQSRKNVERLLFRRLEVLGQSGLTVPTTPKGSFEQRFDELQKQGMSEVQIFEQLEQEGF